MKVIWAPWRADYIRQEKGEGCIFCNALAEDDEKGLILWRGEVVFVMMNRFPYSPGHIMVSPIRHIKGLADLSQDEASSLMKGIVDAVSVLSETLRPDGFNVGLNLGRVAGAGYEDHLHFHIVPRWNGDYNFMPVISETRVISEHLLKAYKRLRGGFDLLKS